METFFKFVRTGLLSLVFLISFSIPATRGDMKHLGADHQLWESERKADVNKIMVMMRTKITDPKLLEKTREKLLTLNDSELVLITSLSEKITKDRERPATDIAFLLITVLIILS